MASSKLSSRHITALDGLRGLAILLVVIHHIFEVFHKSSPLETMLIHISDIGWSGVDLFFCLSGFLITGILVDSKGQEKALRRFYYRRTLRIFPLYYASLIVIFLIYPNIVEVDYQNSIDKQWWYWTYLVNVLISIPGEVGHTATHFWSLAVEEQFYLVWPFVVFALSKRKLLIVSIVLVVITPFIRWLFIELEYDRSMPYVLTISRMDSLLFGAVIALAMRDARLSEIVQRYAPIALLIGTAAFLFVFLRQGTFARQELMLTMGLTSLATIFASVIAITVNGKLLWLDKLLSNGFLVFFGKVSYSMYIMHGVIIAWLGKLLFEYTHDNQLLWGMSGIPKMIIFSVLVLLLSSLVSWLSWHFFEKHFLRLKNKY